MNGLMEVGEPSEHMVLNGVVMGESICQAYLESDAVKQTRTLASELCQHIYTLGWVSGTGGSISIKVQDNSVPKSSQLIVMSPSGPHLYSLSTRTHIHTPALVCLNVYQCIQPYNEEYVLYAGVQKERMVPEDFYVLSSDGYILSTPPLKPCPHNLPKCTDCAPLFLKVYFVFIGFCSFFILHNKHGGLM